MLTGILFFSLETKAFALFVPVADMENVIPLSGVAPQLLIGLTREDYPNYHDLLSITFSKKKQKPRVIEEDDSCPALCRPSKPKPASPLL